MNTPLTDTERLEWLVTGYGKERAAYVMGNDKTGYSVCDCADGLTFMSRDCKTWREAIDEAIKFPTKGKK